MYAGWFTSLVSILIIDTEQAEMHNTIIILYYRITCIIVIVLLTGFKGEDLLFYRCAIELIFLSRF